MKDRDERFADLTTRQMNVRPRDPGLRCKLGRLFLERGARPSAERWLLSAVQLDPHYRPAHKRAGELRGAGRLGEGGAAAAHGK